MNQKEPKQSNATHNQQQQFLTNFSLPCPQSGRFSNSFINGRGFIYLSILKLSFTFQVFTRVEGRVSIKAARKANI